MKPKRPSALFRHIETLHGKKPWGSVLDAGTGVNSISWVQGLATEHWTAITGSASEAARVRKQTQETQRPQDRIIQGNWVDQTFLKDEVYDTVLADYLLGAIEGFAPYLQSYLFSRLKPLTRNVIYVTGLEPYVPISKPENKAGALIWEIGHFRDACVIMAGGNAYREYPAQWVVHHLDNAGFDVKNVKHFKIGYKERFVNAQIDIALHSLKAMADKTVAKALNQRGEALRAEALNFIAQEGALRFCRNYVIAAEPKI